MLCVRKSSCPVRKCQIIQKSFTTKDWILCVKSEVNNNNNKSCMDAEVTSCAIAICLRSWFFTVLMLPVMYWKHDICKYTLHKILFQTNLNETCKTQPCSKTAHSTCPEAGSMAAGHTPPLPTHWETSSRMTTFPSPIHWETSSWVTWPAFGSIWGERGGGGVTACSVMLPRSKIKGLWSGCKSACQHDFMTQGPILCRPNHTDDDRCVGYWLSRRVPEVSYWGERAACF